MLNNIQNIFYIFIICPLLFYMGFIIYFNNYDISEWIAIVTFILILFIIIHHIIRYIYLIKEYNNTKKISKEIGLFYILFSIALLIFNIYLYYRLKY